MNYTIRLLNECDIRIIACDDPITERRDGDIIVSDVSIFRDIIRDGSLGAGESYMKEKWECHNNKLDVLAYKILSNNLYDKFEPMSWSNMFWVISTYIINYQTKSKSYNVENRHYNIGNELYQCMLGKSMSYSCAYFKDDNTDLTRAQYDKFQLICEKMRLVSSDRVLDIGCGFGTLDEYMVRNKQCDVVGINISKEQLKYAYEIHGKLEDELKKKLSFIDCDYREISGSYTKIVSVGMFEHIGYKNYRAFFQKVYDCLANDGIFLLHTIGNNKTATCTDPWIDKYIFPGGMLPSIKQIGEATEGLLVLEDLHNFGPDYDKTLMAWHRNYQDARISNKIIKDKSFDRMWEYYLLSCAGSFRARNIQLWQFVFTKNSTSKYTGTR